MSSSWGIDLKSCSPETLFDLANQLKGSDDKTQLLSIQKEIIERVRGMGASNQVIVDLLIRNMWKGERAALAEDWSEAMGISELEFRKLANVRKS